VQINLNGFDDQMRRTFQDFAVWLLARVGAHKAALSVNKYYRFFKAIDVEWSAVPDYEGLLKHFGAGVLRQAELPMTWLTETERVTVDEHRRDLHSEARRIKSTLAELQSVWSRKILSGYHQMLCARVDQQETDLRSVRLALRAAANLLKVARLEEGAMPSMKHLEAYWRSSPGQVAAVTGFVGFLNRSYGLQLKSKPDQRWLAEAKRAKAEHELVALLKDLGAENFETLWIVKALAYFHGISRVSRKELSYAPESIKGTAGFNVTHGSAKLWVPSASSFNPTPQPSTA
jgi:hypothetical protein